MSIDGPSLMSSGFQRYLPKAFQGAVKQGAENLKSNSEKLISKSNIVSTFLTKRKVFTKCTGTTLLFLINSLFQMKKHFCLCIYPSLAIKFSLNGLFRMIQLSACPVWVSIGRVELQVVYSAGERRLVSWWWES